MANTLTNLIPDMYEALDTVSRELVGFIPAVRSNNGVDRAALNQSVLVPVTPSASTAANTAGVTAPDTGDQSISNVSVSISKSKHVAVRWSGEETKGLMNAGTFSSIQAERFYQGMRALVNEIETDLWTEAYQSASRAYGTAGTAPFGTVNVLTDSSETRRILEENGSPTTDLQLVLGHAAMSNLRGKQSGLFHVNEAGSPSMLRDGMFDRLQGFAVRHSNAVGVHTKGTGANYVTNSTTTNAIGDTVIPADGGTGTILAGDVVTLETGGATYKYIVNTALSGGSFAIGEPGLKVAEVDGNTVTVGANFTANVAFDRGAIVLATRPPALPEGGDMADDAMMITDERTGVAFEIAVYRQFLQTVYHVRLAWGYAAVKPAHIAVLLG